MVFYNVILETSHTYCHILLITNMSLSPAHTQDRGITQGHQCQEVIIGDHLKKLPIYLSSELIFSMNNVCDTILLLAQTRNTRLALYSFTSPLTPVNPSRCLPFLFHLLNISQGHIIRRLILSIPLATTLVQALIASCLDLDWRPKPQCFAWLQSGFLQPFCIHGCYHHSKAQIWVGQSSLKSLSGSHSLQIKPEILSMDNKARHLVLLTSLSSPLFVIQLLGTTAIFQTGRVFPESLG